MRTHTPSRLDDYRSMNILFEGLSPDDLNRTMDSGADHLGCPVTPFVDDEGGWPLRCCLADSQVGDELAIVSASPFPWTSPYRTASPVVVHATGCRGADGTFPRQFDQRAQIVRAYGTDGSRIHSLVYDLNAHVPAGGGLQSEIARILADPRVEFVHAHNVLSGCYSFTARRQD